jgi:hypothetical protein
MKHIERKPGGVGGEHVDWSQVDQFIGKMPHDMLARITGVSRNTIWLRAKKIGRKGGPIKSVDRIVARALGVPKIR